MEPTAGKTKKDSGFTLIELLVTLAVAVILATVAVPNFQGLIARNQLVADHNEILTGLNYARSEAVKQRDAVTAVLASDADGAGWTLEVWDGDGSSVVNCPADIQCLRVRDESGSPVNISTTSDGKVTFNSLGRLSGSSTVQFDLSHGEGNQESICIGLAGRVGSDCG
ncbi:GspH/FimT family pseudopilin [Halomonas ramblicola]|uniref:GspH/FimT family pseudopilin n=1 Tax=Halomonas ramblicola TaxID=747349 RepID=UPI0025B31DD1|nr:GspH/FimT family pseudopilin [Halomonas ramblicola]MDN3521491.1 GspH/FimT family pseudopilin [Halomonas ramblicola]